MPDNGPMLWRRLLDIGIQHAPSSGERRRVRHVNGFLAIGAVVALTYAAGTAAAGVWVGALINLTVAALIVPIVLLGARGHLVLQRVSVFVLIHASLLLFSALVGSEFGAAVVLVAMIPLPVLAFSRDHDHIVGPMLALWPVSVFVVTFVFGDGYQAPFANDAARTLYPFTLLLCSIAVAVVALLVRVESARTQARLVAAAEQAQAAARAKSAFLANMSHEIRTPLAGVVGVTDLLMLTELEPHQRELLETANNSADHLLQVINDILDLSKVQAGALEIRPVPVDVPMLVEQCVSLMRTQAELEGVHLEGKTDVDHPVRLLDPLRMRQVLLNLVGNGLKFTQEGSVVIEAWDEGPRLHIVVHDTGIGISESARMRIFDTFVQAEEGPTRTFGGTGLGLSISQAIVDAMGGELEVESTPGVGSSFGFSIIAPSTTAEQDDEPPGPRQLHAVRRLRVLVAEDDEVSRMVVQRQLESLGHTVLLAADGALAVQALRTRAVDVVLMDMHMPRLDGLEATRAMRKLDAGATVPIYALTANALPEATEACLAAGMDGFLAKPLRMDRLARVLDEVAVASRDPVAG